MSLVKHLQTRDGFNMRPLTEWSNRFPTLRRADASRKRRGDLGRAASAAGTDPRSARRQAAVLLSDARRRDLRVRAEGALGQPLRRARSRCGRTPGASGADPATWHGPVEGDAERRARLARQCR